MQSEGAFETLANQEIDLRSRQRADAFFNAQITGALQCLDLAREEEVLHEVACVVLRLAGCPSQDYLGIRGDLAPQSLNGREVTLSIGRVCTPTYRIQMPVSPGFVHQ